MSDAPDSFIHAPWIMDLSFVLTTTLIMLIVAFFGGGISRHKYNGGQVRSPGLSVISLYAAIGSIALFASIFTLGAHIETKGYIGVPTLRVTCNVVDAKVISALKSPSGGISPSTENQEITSFELNPEDNVKAGMSKMTELNGYIRELARLASIPVGLAFVFLLRFAYSSPIGIVMQILPRVSVSAAFVGGSILALLTSHNLLFSTVNAQVSILGAGMAYCYNDFAPIYSQVFFITEAAALMAIAAMIALPEGVRLNYVKA